MADVYTPTTEEVRARHAARDTAGFDAGATAFDRWLAAHDAQKRAEWEAERLAEQGEVKWEYGVRAIDDDIPIVSTMPSFESAKVRANNIRGGWIVVRRQTAGPWELVDENRSDDA